MNWHKAQKISHEFIVQHASHCAVVWIIFLRDFGLKSSLQLSMRETTRNDVKFRPFPSRLAKARRR